ncbi:lipoamide acyltransferase [Tripterygium wilfordii]|uniref:Dihydrolipoamide acetyltransferase component of pyruvate dehydrogenase complex n=1 Tax=Tripterygium wilfordii TaxID=458696 RepID=A0A7J7CSC0_TRIWF|nr:lipoamide acyltransferase component of branched-chain alpha-keto acid dehydrogenase complex, mitochondrial-like [Tripterygium wilfordii]KAF5737007.1 lipoamide acyltransferase [Tripterygium wilfordii]
MICRRIWHGRAWSSCRRILYPYAAESPSPFPSPVSWRSSFDSASCLYASNQIAFDFLLASNRRHFSIQNLVEFPVGEVVDVPLAQTGEGIAECELLRWFVQEGEIIEEFQPLCEVQSDKATIEITSRHKGTVSELLYIPGDIVKVGETLVKMVVGGSHCPRQSSDSPEIDLHKKENNVSAPEQNKTSVGGVLSTPAVRHFAEQYGIMINDIHGSGKDGRVLKEDVQKYAIQKGLIKDPSATVFMESEKQFLGGENEDPYVSAEVKRHYDDKFIPLRGFHRAMVKSMSMAAKVPHFHYVEEIICDALVELKVSFQNNHSEADVKFTFLPLLIKSLSMALSKFPFMNSCFNEELLEVILKGSHNIGVAMATPQGLVVPNIKDVQNLSILEITKELSRLQCLARDNKLSPGDVSGGTITLSNIGAIGGKFGVPLLNLPEVAIIALGRIQKVPRLGDDGNVYPVSIMSVNIGADHRVLDGATVAKFCNEWKQLIEKPELLVLHLR